MKLKLSELRQLVKEAASDINSSNSVNKLHDWLYERAPNWADNPDWLMGYLESRIERNSEAMDALQSLFAYAVNTERLEIFKETTKAIRDDIVDCEELMNYAKTQLK